MKLIAGNLNRNWLKGLLEESKGHTEIVLAAVAYANGNPELLDFCYSNKIKLTFWCRYDWSVPVSINILEAFINRRSPNFVCKLVADIYHPKVIWWQGFGVYIGSANLTHSGWYANIECGVFLSESDLDEQGLRPELERFFNQVDERSFPLTQEVLDELKKLKKDQRSFILQQKEFEDAFMKTRKVPKQPSISSVDKISSDEGYRNDFIAEWNSTLEILRAISDRVSMDNMRPAWINANVPKGVQGDQFLNAYYYGQVRTGNRYPFFEYYEMNYKNPEGALVNMMMWWKKLADPPSNEDIMIYKWSPFLRKQLSSESLAGTTLADFTEICSCVYAIRDHSLRVSNETYGLPRNYPKKGREECIKLLANYLWKQKTSNGATIIDTISFVLYGGSMAELSSRLWEATNSEKWRIPHFGISCLGEIVGWALPDTFPPRNGRSSKALTALGYSVKIHSE